MKYLITGISGTLGQAVAKILLEDPTNEVIGYSRDECKQAALAKHDRLTLYLGDVRDRNRLLEASRNVDLVFHFAALKHVDILEENPEESIATNIEGTLNVLHAQRIHGIKRVILSSTDKACYPINVYGACKSIAEKLTLRNPENIVCRYGNVIASRGSAIPSFIKTLKEEITIYLTDPNMTRFWISIDEASQFVAAQSKVKGGGLKIPPMKSCPIHLIPEVIAHLMKVPSYQTKYVGTRAGEKINECLRMAHEGEEIHSHLAQEFTWEELTKLLSPIVKGQCA